jgi:hypothetical protein
MSEKRFQQDLDEMERELSINHFLLYGYKTSFCPILNEKHNWSDCNYAHRMQDFRRPPQNYFYLPEWCSQINDEESWVECEDKMNCQYSHTLVEILFNPLHYKLHDCPDRVPSDKYACEEKKDICAYCHSAEEREAY